MTKLYLSTSSHDEYTETPAFAVVDGNLWDLRREVDRLRSICVNNGLVSVVSQCHVAHPEWHDPDEQFCVEGNEMIVDAYGNVRFDGTLLFSNEPVMTGTLAYSTLTTVAGSAVSEWFEANSIQTAVRLALAEGP